MASQNEQRRIVSCNTCERPYLGIINDEGQMRIGGGSGQVCPNCGGGDFSRISL